MTSIFAGPILALLALPGCERTVVFPDTGERVLPECLTLGAPAVDFGVTAVGEGPVERVLSLVNACEDEDVGVDWVSAAAPFHAEPPLDVLIAPGEESGLPIHFEPGDEGEFEGQLVLITTDRSQPERLVPLTGVALESELSLEPEAWDAGGPPIGCPSARELVLVNSGSAPLVVDGIELLTDTSEFTLELPFRELGGLPWVLGPEGSAVGVAHYRPLDTFDDEAFVLVSSTDPDRATHVASLAGDGTLYRARHERFTVEGPEAADVLLVVDRSPSMGADLDRFLPAAGAFFQELATTSDLDWRVAAVVADDGCVLAGTPYLDASTDPEAIPGLLEAMIDRFQALDTSSTLWESGFLLATAALDSSASPGCNHGLLHDSDMPLHVVHVSDTSDQSDVPWPNYLDELHTHRDSEDLVAVHALVGDLPSGCGDAEGGHGYVQAATESGGQFTSICTPDLEPPMRTLAQRVQGRPRHLPLSEEPVRETILVRAAGGDPLPPWHYDGDENAIAFEEAQLPALGTEILVSYHVMPPTCP